MTKRKNKVDISKMFEEEETDFLESLNVKIKDGMLAENMVVMGSAVIDTEFGESLRIHLVDNETDNEYSFLCSGKVFRKLFEDNVKENDIIKIYLNEKQHWRFEFSE